MPQTKIIVLDDDPTGSQTVHSCLLLMRWDVATLKEALADNAPLFFVLTNTRGMSAERASTITREVCRNLKLALAGEDIHPLFVSRSDSTLRGHYPVETDVMAEELGPFDAHFLVPAFFEGGRITRDSVHYLRTGGKETPVHETEFARDSIFGFKHKRNSTEPQLASPRPLRLCGEAFAVGQAARLSATAKPRATPARAINAAYQRATFG